MTRIQQMTLGYYCQGGGADGHFNPKCTNCQAEMIQAEHDRLEELYFEQKQEQYEMIARDPDYEMDYVDELEEQ